MRLKSVISWVLRLIASVILLQTLYFKFSAHPESVVLFTKLGVEPWGRIGIGVFELITGVLLLLPASVFIGAILGIGLMSGAIFAHLTVIGISSNGDGGELFILAIIEFITCSIISVIYYKQGIDYYKKLFKK